MELFIMLIRNVYISQLNKIQSILINHDGSVTILEPSSPPPEGVTTVDAENNYTLMPGLLDAHIHGIAGHDFTDGTMESIAGITQKLGEIGVSYCVATLASLELSRLKSTLSVLDAYIVEQTERPKPGIATIVGVHLEGPFISAKCRGAHDKKVLQSEINMAIMRDIISAAPHVTNWKITLAPDVKGAIEFIRQVKIFNDQPDFPHISIFIGHTNASRELIQEAIDAGASGFTHLGNDNGERAQRWDFPLESWTLSSDVVKEAFSRKTIKAELIVDTEHLSPHFVRFTVEQLGKNIILVSDALSPADFPENEARMLGTVAVVRKGSKVVEEKYMGDLAGGAFALPKVIEIFHTILSDAQTPRTEIIDKIFHGAVLNPRETSLRAGTKLLDHLNFVLINNQTGEVALHSCHGKLFFRDKKFKKEIEEADTTQQSAMRIVGRYLSVLTDIPNFVVTSRWFAKHADEWWRFHAGKIFGAHPPSVVPAQLHYKTLNWRGLFFKHYLNEHDLHYRRRTLLITDGNIEQLKKDNDDGIKIRNCTWGSYFPACDIFGGCDYSKRKTLHAVAHEASDDSKKRALDYFFDIIVKEQEIPESRLTILRNFLDIPELTYWNYYSAVHYLKYKFNSPIAEALHCNDFEMALIMIKCGANLSEEYQISYHPDENMSMLDYVISRVAKLITHGYTRKDFRTRMASEIPFHIGHRPNYDDPSELIEYCRLHFSEQLEQAATSIKPARLTA